MKQRCIVIFLVLAVAACDSKPGQRPPEVDGGGGGGDHGVLGDVYQGDGPPAVPTGRFCYPVASCWEAPLPQGNGLHGVWGAAADDVHAVGLEGMILHFDGARWAVSSSPTNASLYGVWGSGPTDVWAVGSGPKILHFDGEVWEAQTLPELSNSILRGIWGSGPQDIFAVGTDGTILHYDGSSWEESHVQAAGDDEPDELTAVWGSGAGDVWAVSYRAIWRFDGEQWAEVDASPLKPEGLNGIWGVGPDNIFFNGLMVWRYQGGIWSESEVTPEFTSGGAIWGAGPAEVYAIRKPTMGGQLWRFDGQGWDPLPDAPLPLVPDAGHHLHHLWGAGPGQFHLVGSGGTLLSYVETGGWTSHVELQGGTVTSIAGSSADNVFVGRLGGEVLHRDGDGWHDTGFPGEDHVEGLWVSGTQYAYASSGGAIWRHDGAAWTKLPSPSSVEFESGLWGRSDKEIYCGARLDSAGGGPSHGILRYDGDEWTTIKELESCSVNALWGSSAGPDLTGVGTCGLFFFDGQDWTVLNHVVVPVTGFADALWGDGPDNIYVAGAKDLGSTGIILHYNGDSWAEEEIPSVGHLRAIWGQSASEIYAAGWADDGFRAVILRFDGEQWTVMSGAVNPIIHALWGDGESNLFAGGMYGTILHRGP